LLKRGGNIVIKTGYFCSNPDVDVHLGERLKGAQETALKRRERERTPSENELERESSAEYQGRGSLTQEARLCSGKKSHSNIIRKKAVHRIGQVCAQRRGAEIQVRRPKPENFPVRAYGGRGSASFFGGCCSWAENREKKGDSNRNKKDQGGKFYQRRGLEATRESASNRSPLKEAK